ncbi:LysR family transcriptional regulator [Stenotrophomonas sp. 24(2023)]|uniref:LysR family transcriptional regulator n=1 Tax=Stenotrophomonas sp. 24(2023) TaxID=3068324 RepID=UPI0027E08ED4|nr:LysR family transcriptional regulator [Stenotrophomonas sp. 24(2023)]WMJ68224.1 LysR substrate-binding domain-containing protein [Stenotrophomonas sp. 24(2023)]
MDHLKGMRLFIRVVESGSFVGAGKAEGVAQSTVSKEVAALERRLGTQLLRRSSRGLSVTDAGQEYFEFATRMLADLDAVETRLRAGEAAPRGRLRVALPPVLSSRVIMPALPALLQQFPGLALDIEVSERYANLVEEGVDVAIRIGQRLSDSSLRAWQIGSLEPMVVASPGYLASHGVPLAPADLQHHSCLPFLFQRAQKSWKFRDGQTVFTVTPEARLRTNDADGIHAAARAGMGLAQGPSWMFADDIAAGALVPVLTRYTAQRVPIWAVTPNRHRMDGAVRLLADALARIIDSAPHLHLPPR